MEVNVGVHTIRAHPVKYRRAAPNLGSRELMKLEIPGYEKPNRPYENLSSGRVFMWRAKGTTKRNLRITRLPNPFRLPLIQLDSKGKEPYLLYQEAEQLAEFFQQELGRWLRVSRLDLATDISGQSWRSIFPSLRFPNKQYVKGSLKKGILAGSPGWGEIKVYPKKERGAVRVESRPGSRLLRQKEVLQLRELEQGWGAFLCPQHFTFCRRARDLPRKYRKMPLDVVRKKMSIRYQWPARSFWRDWTTPNQELINACSAALRNFEWR